MYPVSDSVGESNSQVLRLLAYDGVLLCWLLEPMADGASPAATGVAVDPWRECTLSDEEVLLWSLAVFFSCSCRASRSFSRSSASKTLALFSSLLISFSLTSSRCRGDLSGAQSRFWPFAERVVLDLVSGVAWLPSRVETVSDRFNEYCAWLGESVWGIDTDRPLVEK